MLDARVARLIELYLFINFIAKLKSKFVAYYVDALCCGTNAMTFDSIETKWMSSMLNFGPTYEHSSGRNNFIASMLYTECIRGLQCVVVFQQQPHKIGDKTVEFFEIFHKIYIRLRWDEMSWNEMKCISLLSVNCERFVVGMSVVMITKSLVRVSLGTTELRSNDCK